jgi:hypothetical protein
MLASIARSPTAGILLLFPLFFLISVCRFNEVPTYQEAAKA